MCSMSSVVRMNTYIDDMVKAVSTRKSRRKFNREGLNAEHTSSLKEFIASIEVPFDSAVDVTLHTLPQGSSVCHFAEPETFVAFSAPGTLTGQAMAGFVGELLILYCESQSIGTCWYGHYKKKNVYDIVYGTTEENAPKKVHSITPVGYCTEKPTGLYDKLTNVMFSSKKNTVEQNLHKDSLKDFSDSIRFGLELACKAPSAMNSQCWYFKVSELGEGYEVEIAKPAGYKHIKWAYPDIDVGTAAAHFWIGLLQKEIQPQVLIEEADDRIIWRFRI